MWILRPNIERLKTKQNVKGLIRALSYRKEAAVREQAAKTLGQMGDPRALEPLVAALADELRGVRGSAAEALGLIGDPRAVIPLATVLKDKYVLVRKRAAAALGVLGGDRARDLLITALEDRDRNVREVVAEALDRLGWQPDGGKADAWYWIAKRDWQQAITLGPLAVDPLIATLTDHDQGVRRSAARALGKIRDTKAIEPLAAILKDKTVDARAAAAEALGEIGRAQAVDALVAVFDGGRDYGLYRAAARALADIGGARAAEGLVDNLRNAGTEGVNALVSIGEPAVQRLIRVLKDEKHPMGDRKLAAKALVGLYHSRKLGEKHKQSILAVRSIITSRRHSDGESCGHIDQDVSVFDVRFPLDKESRFF